MLHLVGHFRRAVWRAFQHEAFATAKGAAYSSILTVFPGFLILASILAASNQTAKLTREISYALGRVLPAGTNALALTYFSSSNIRPVRVIISASLVMLTAASGVIVSWMSAFRRAYGIQVNPWGFWKERAIALLLVPLSMVPLGFATVLVGFGNQLQNWLAAHTIYELRGAILLLWVWGRWSIGALTSIAVIGVIYHLAIPRTQNELAWKAFTSMTASAVAPPQPQLRRKAKIVCTLGPASSSPAIVRELIHSGMDVARLNFSHGTYEEKTRLIATIREVAASECKPICILQDLQ